MALHRVRLDSTSSGGVNQENDQDDEMASEKQRLDIIEVLSLMPVTRDAASVVYLSKNHMLSMRRQKHTLRSFARRPDRDN